MDEAKQHGDIERMDVLWKLLHHSTHDAPLEELPPAVVAAVHAARECRSYRTEAEHRRLTSAVCAVWMSLSRLEDRHPLRLPPLYAEAMAARDCVATLVRLLDRIEWAETAGSIIMQGVAGVGKSTILRATQIVGVLVFDVLCPLWDFSRAGYGFASPLCVLRDAVAAVVDDTPTLPPASECKEAESRGEVMFGALGQLRERGWRGPLLLADRVDALYRADAPQRCLDAVAELLCIAKTNALGAAVLAGAVAELRGKAFCAGTEWGGRGYPDLDRSVYLASCLMPVRTASALSKWFQLRYPGMAVPTGLLYYTGGVGREVEALLTGGRDALRAYIESRVGHALDPHRSRVAAAFLHKYRGAVSQDEVPFVRMCDVTQVGLHLEDISRLEDASVLLCVGDRVELLYPAALAVLRDIVGRSAVARRNVALRACFAYLDQDSYKDAVPHVLDALARGRLWEVAHRGLTMRWDGVVCVAATSAPVGEQPLAHGALGLDALCNQIIQVSQDTGIHGFYLTGGQGLYSVHVLQLALGQWDPTGGDPGQITAGCLESARASAWQCLNLPPGAAVPGHPTPNVTAVQGSTVAVATAALEIGVDWLLTLLKTAFPGSDAHPVAWRVGGVHLVTSKRVDVAHEVLRVRLCDAEARVYDHTGVPAANAEARCSVTIDVIDHDELFDNDLLGLRTWAGSDHD